MDLSRFPILYSRRRTIAITIRRDGALVIRAPIRASEQRIRQFVESKREWVEKTLRKVAGYQPARKEFVEGEKFLFLGEYYPLAVTGDYRRRLHFEDGFVISKFFQGKARQLFLYWYKEQAKKYISERTAHWARMMNLAFKNITIKNSQSQWGSCSTLGNLNFSFRLIMAPPDIIDYVIVHELAHLVHHNHSVGFWKLVAAFYPNHKAARKWLNHNGQHLVV